MLVLKTKYVLLIYLVQSIILPATSHPSITQRCFTSCWTFTANLWRWATSILPEISFNPVLFLSLPFAAPILGSSLQTFVFFNCLTWPGAQLSRALDEMWAAHQASPSSASWNPTLYARFAVLLCSQFALYFLNTTGCLQHQIIGEEADWDTD